MIRSMLSKIRNVADTIQVYSPHTALDAAPGGICDWLADIVTGTPVTAVEDQKKEDGSDSEKNSAEEDPFVDKRRPIYMLQHHPSHRDVIKDADLKLCAFLCSIRLLNPMLTTFVEEPPAIHANQ